MSWYYIDAWDWAVEGGQYVWKRVGQTFQQLPAEEVETVVTRAHNTLTTTFGIKRCFKWSRSSGSTGFIWERCTP